MSWTAQAVFEGKRRFKLSEIGQKRARRGGPNQFAVWRARLEAAILTND